MTIAYGTSNAVLPSTVSSFSVGLPASTTANDMLVMHVSSKPYTTVVNTPSGWTKVAEINSGTGAAGNGSGSQIITTFAATGITSAPTVTTSGANSIAVHIHRYTKTESAWADPVGVAAADTSNNATTNLTFTGMSVAAGDWYSLGISHDDDVVNNGTSRTISQTGATLGTVTQRGASGSTQGNDVGLTTYDITCTAGSSSADVIYSHSQSAATDNGGALVRLREAVPSNQTVTPTGIATGETFGTAVVFVQRTSTATLPSVVSDWATWFEADSVTTVPTGQGVSSLTDLSSNAAHATQGTGSLQPTFHDSIINGLPVIRFDGSDDILNSSSTTVGAASQTVYAVVRFDDLTSKTNTIQGTSGNPGGIQLRSTDSALTVNRQNASPIIDVAGGISEATWYVITVSVTSGGAYTLWRNGTQVTTGSTAVTWAGDTALTLKIGNQVNAGEAFDGDIALLATGTRIHTTTERNAVHYHIQQRYGITISGAAPAADIVAPTAIGSAEAFGTATVSLGPVTVTGIPTGEAFGTAKTTISVAPQAISSAEAHGSPTVTPGAVSTVPTGITSAEAHGSPTVTPGTVSVAPQAISSAETFGSPTVANIVTLTLTGIGSTEAHGSPTVTPGAVSATPTGITSAEVHGTPTLTPGATSVVPQSISSAETFGSMSVSIGAVTLTLTGIASAEAHGSPTITTGAVSVAPAGISTGEVIGDHTVTLVTWPSYGVGYGGGGNLLPDAIDSIEAFGVPTLVPGATSVAPNGIPSGETFGTVTTGRTATPAPITSAETFGTTSVSTGSVSVAPTGIGSGQALGSPTVTPGTATLAPAGIASQEAAGAPTLTTGPVTLAPAGIASQEGHGTPTVTSGRTLAPTGIGSGEAVPAPAVLADQVVTATGIGSVETFGTATVSTGPVSVAPTGIGSGQALGSPTLTTGYTVAASGIGSAESVATPLVSAGAVVIAPAGVGSAEALGLVVVQAGPVVMAPTVIGSGESVSSVLVRQLWTIALQGIPSAEILEPVSISVFLAAWVDRPFTGTIDDSDTDWVLRPYTGMT